MLGELVDLGVKYGFLEKSGSWYSAGEIRIGQGRDAAKQYLRDNPEFAEKLEQNIRAQLAGTSEAPGEALPGMAPAAEELAG